MAYCPHCRTENPSTASQCWLCHEKLSPGEEPEQPPASPHSASSRVEKPSILLSAVLILVVIGCIGLLFSAAFGLGIILLLVLAPVLIRLWMPSSAGQSDFRRGITAFFVLVWAGLAALVGFCVTCTGIFFGLNMRGGGDFWQIWVGAILGLLVAGFLGFRIIRKHWPGEGTP